eukprot:1157087-Pelagomonas_calceolata.AAC.12
MKVGQVKGLAVRVGEGGAWAATPHTRAAKTPLLIIHQTHDQLHAPGMPGTQDHQGNKGALHMHTLV